MVIPVSSVAKMFVNLAETRQRTKSGMPFFHFFSP